MARRCGRGLKPGFTVSREQNLCCANRDCRSATRRGLVPLRERLGDCAQSSIFGKQVNRPVFTQRNAEHGAPEVKAPAGPTRWRDRDQFVTTGVHGAICPERPKFEVIIPGIRAYFLAIGFDYRHVSIAHNQVPMLFANHPNTSKPLVDFRE